MNWSDFILRLFKAAEPFLAIRVDMDHALVSHRYARLLLDREGGDHRIVEPAIVLHDVGWSALDPDQIRAAYGVRPSGEEASRLNRIHEVQGAMIARRILDAENYDPGLTDWIVEIIERHDSGQEAFSQEERLIKDADKLWRFSELGLWQELDRQSGVGPWEYHQYVGTRIDAWFFTSTARNIAREELDQRAAEITARDLAV